MQDKIKCFVEFYDFKVLRKSKVHMQYKNVIFKL